MMRPICTSLLLAVGLTVAGTMALAEPGITYECDVSSPGGRGWIAPRILIGVDQGETRALVLDGLIQGVHGKPLAGSVSPRDDTSIQIKWTVTDMPVDGLKTKEKVQYRAVIFKATGRFLVTAELSQFDNQPRGSGTCKSQRSNIDF